MNSVTKLEEIDKLENNYSRILLRINIVIKAYGYRV